ncbi:MAG: hypothetical protein HYY64_10455 [Candidatus Rokubacteria bacterium]|nr:hypothetical protein [Candidatus Rokubacteria bacterium]
MRRSWSLPWLVGILAFCWALGVTVALPPAGQERPKAPLSTTPAATILAAPEDFEGQQVAVRGTVESAQRDVFPNGRPYYTLSVADGQAVVTVFSWSRPAARAGDRIEAMGVFHVWRYNIRHMIDAIRIDRLENVR